MNDRITCIRCGERTVYVTPKGAVGRLCGQCFLIAFSEIPDPDCEHCQGNREYYWHSEDCTNDLCSLAGGYDDCQGRMIVCGCSIFDKYI
jgi:hypothetical protein